MHILSLETSSPQKGSWAVFEDGRLLAAATFEGMVSQKLPSSLAHAREWWQRADVILIGVGPGSYSGVRVAVATAQGMQVALGCGLVAVRSSDAAAELFLHEERLAILASGRRGECVVSWYEKGRMSPSDRACYAVALDQLEGELAGATAVVRLDSEIQHGTLVYAHALHLARHWMRCGVEDGLALEPIHLAAIQAQTR